MATQLLGSRVVLSSILVVSYKGASVELWRSEGKRPLGRPRRRWANNSKLGLGEIGGGSESIDQALDRDCWFGFRKCWEILEWLIYL
jgi:hypothetical protein